MGKKSADEILGLEFDWLAIDADDHIALFSTAGGGYAPEEFLSNTEEYDVAIDAILTSRASTTPRFAPELPPGLKNLWRMVAERGLFAYDSDVDGGPYRLVAAPELPVLVTGLPQAAAAIGGLIAFPHLRFAELSTISAELLQQSR